MSTIEEKRHSLAHLLAAAILELYPNAKNTIGPAIENGFYYDFEFSSPVGDADLKEIEKKMKKISNTWTTFEKEEVEAEEAKEIYKDNSYKLELVEEITSKGEAVTLYTSGKFTDLCRGGHVEDMQEIDNDSWKLSRVAGAYWRGDENNKMLTRIYGLAFDTKEELEAYERNIEEAKKRDHRKLGKEMDLFTFSDLVGSGMPLWTPRGNIIRNSIINYSRELNEKLGFGEVHTPNINKAELFKCSGHYDQYKDDMLSVHSQYVEDEMFMKPMNCPQHTQIYDARPRSYRDLPIRYADFANLYRDERPGELSGLTRLRAFAQDDGHIFCREGQVHDELVKVLRVIKEALVTYGVEYWVRLSLRDPDNKEDYLGTDAEWERSEQELKAVVEQAQVKFEPVTGEAAFYGPKLDIMAVDALGRQWQISTIQVDRVQPERFDLTCTNEQGEKERIVMIHRALIGSPDRFLGILIEHYAGAFPLWLSPVQVKVLPIGEGHIEYAKGIFEKLKQENIRVELDDSNESLGKKIRNSKTEKVPYALIIGDKEVESKQVTVESRDNGNLGTLSADELVMKLKEEISQRK
jgi:threonyl-tRNA synthetase